MRKSGGIGAKEFSRASSETVRLGSERARSQSHMIEYVVVEKQIQE